MFKEDLALNNKQWLIYLETKPNQLLFDVNILQANNLQVYGTECSCEIKKCSYHYESHTGYCTKYTILTLHCANRRLQRYGIQMELRAAAVLLDICTTTMHSHLYFHVVNGFMLVALRL